MKTIAKKLKSFFGRIAVFLFASRARTAAFFSALILISLLVSVPAISRYVSEVNALFNDNGEDKEHLDFTVNTVFVVRNQNELFAAINQGYSYIQISDDLHNPFVITQSPKALTTDLIIDLNGIELYRHGTNPIFEVTEGVRLTITDTSETQRGCLYNPTGSVLKIDGGNLTVVSGKFECGPRYSEYYTYNNNILSDKSNKRTIVDSLPHKVDFYKRVGEGVNATFDHVLIDAPIIEAYDTSYDGGKHHHGNLYFDFEVQVGSETNEALNFKIEDDTYCYYTTNEDDSYDVMKMTAYMSDWYYTYHVDSETYEYKANPTDADIEVTIYGYENTIENAETRADPGDIDQPENNFFAAIKMFGGTFDIRLGDFYNYFGVNTTACIDMMGGELIIKEGNFSTRIPNANSHEHHSVDAKEDDAAAFDPFNYFDDFHWGKENFGESDPEYDIYKDGIRAHKGEGFGILTSGSAKITIDKGNFYSSNNNLIHMQNGTLNIGGGDFYKTNTQMMTGYDHNDTAIFMHNGELNIGEASYILYGDYARAIRMIDGKLNINGASCIVHGDYSYAVYSSIPGNNLNLTDIKFNMYARTTEGRLTGIYSTKPDEGESGTVTVRTSEGEESYLNIQGQGSVAIRSEGGDVYSQGCTYQIDGNNSAGIYADGGRVTIEGGHIDLTSNINCYGIYAITKSQDVKVEIDVSNTHIDVGYVDTDTPPTTVHTDCKACIGVFLGSANEDSTVTLNNSNVHSYEIGVALSGGKLIIKDSDSTANNIKTNRASAVAVSNGDLVFAEGGTYDLISYNTTTTDSMNSYEMTIPYLDYENGAYVINPVTYRNTDGVYVNGGSIDAKGTVNITHTGLYNGSHSGDDPQNYTSLIVTSYAIRVLGGNINMLSGTITAKSGGGICCTVDENAGTGGHITMGAEGGSGNITVTVTGTIAGNFYGPWGDATVDNNGNLNLNGEHNTWLNKENISGGHAIELNGGNIDIYYGKYETYFGNGICAIGSGTINVHNGEFYGWMRKGENDSDMTGKSGPAAYYGLKVMGGATVNIYGGTYSGGNGGAMVTGVDNFPGTGAGNKPSGLEGQYSKYAKVFVYAGTFGDSSSVDSFNVYDASIVVFGAHTAAGCGFATDTDGSLHRGAITMIASNASIATNAVTDNRGWAIKSIVDVYYGYYFRSSSNGPKGIWNSNATVNVYNENLNYLTMGLTSTGQSYNNVGNTSPVHYTEGTYDYEEGT